MTKLVPLRAVSEFILDGTHGSPVRAEAGVPVLSAQNVKDGTLSYETDRHTSSAEYLAFNRRLNVKKGDLLLTIVGTIGRAAVVEEERPAVFQRSVAVIRPKSSHLDIRFLFHASQSRDFKEQLRRATNKSSQPGVYLGKLELVQVPLPPLEEQRRIAAILDRSDDLRRMRRAAFQKLDSLTQSLFLDMFGDPARNQKSWPMIRLGNLATRFSDGPFGSNLKSEHYRKTGVRVIRLQNIGVGAFIDENTAYISETHFESLIQHQCLPGDVLVGTLGEPNLRACVQPSWLERALNKADCVQIRPKQELANASYISALLNQPSVERMASGMILGQTRLRIAMGRLRELRVPVPPLDLQRKFENALAQASLIKLSSTESLKALDNLHSSIEARAFRGEL